MERRGRVEVLEALHTDRVCCDRDVRLTKAIKGYLDKEELVPGCRLVTAFPSMSGDDSQRISLAGDGYALTQGSEEANLEPQ